MKQKCVICGKQLLEPDGVSGAPMLLVMDSPGWDDILRGQMYGEKLRTFLVQTLGAIGISFYDCRRTLLWRHAPSDEHDCLPTFKNDLAKELEKSKFALLMGNTCELMFGLDSHSYWGIQVRNELIQCKMMAAPNPYHVMSGMLGEWELALQRFNEMKGVK